MSAEIIWVTVSNGLLSAQGLPDYKAWHINQNFDGIAAFNGATPILNATGETLPAGWSFNGSSNNYFSNPGAFYRPFHALGGSDVARFRRGGSSNFNYTLDNLEVYVMKPSKGVEDVTISYIDRDRNPAKEPRVEAAQQVGFRLHCKNAKCFYRKYIAENFGCTRFQLLERQLRFRDYVAKTAEGADSAVVAAHSITVYPAATLILNDSVSTPAVNQITLKVDTTATLQTDNNFTGANIIDVLGTLKGGLTVPNSISFYDKSTVALNVNSFNEGDYDVIDAAGDVTVIGSVLDITVRSSTAGARIPIIKSPVNIDLSFSQVLVNGVDITENTPETEGVEFVWHLDEGTNEGTLLSKTNLSAIDIIAADKPIREIQYFNILGHRISSTGKGIVIKKIIYNDNTFKVQKSFINEK